MQQAKVYLDYTQDELDKAYTQAAWAPNMKDVLARQSADSAKLRSVMAPRTFSYGPHPDETLDVFMSETAKGPIHVHIHGGGWRALTKDDVSFPAPVFTDAGATYIALNFSVIPTVRLPEMVAQAQRAICWLHSNARSFGGDPSRIHLSGHSAGAHMASVLLTTDWSARFGLPADILKSGLLMSGSYDLEPVMLSVRSSYVKISKDELLALSAVRHVEQIRVPVTLVYGDKETPEFQRQAVYFFEVLKKASKTAEMICANGYNHFEIMDVFADPRCRPESGWNSVRRDLR
ncbi:MAG: alpha/beta hydrolase [Xanthobacteraceae bacterium]|nr:alpha/beta hydrolase [Xanthobacteraceae bacterium]